MTKTLDSHSPQCRDRRASRALPALVLLLSAALAGCFGTGSSSTATYAVGGTVSGLTGAGLVLQDNGADDLSVSAAGAFHFATKVAMGAAYAVTVKTQPSSPAQNCMVASGSGTMGTADVTSVAITCTTSSFKIGGTTTGLVGTGLVLQDNAGDDLAVSANGSFQFATSVASGSTYAVTIKTQPTSPAQTCVVTGGSGSVAAADIASVSVSCPPAPGRFAYVSNSGANTVSAYSIDASGALTAIAGSPFATGAAPYQIVASPSGKFVYVVNETGGSVSGFSVDPTTGVLTALAGSPFTVGTQPQGLAFSPSGAFLYVANTGGDTISAFAVDPTSGALSAVAGSPFSNGAGTGPTSIAVDPSGHYAIVANQGSGNLAVYSINASTGALAAVAGSPFGSNLAPFSIAFGAGGKFVYASTSNGTSFLVAGFTLNATSGALTALTPALTAPVDNYVSTDPSGAFLYAAVANSVAVYAIDASSGALTAVSGSPYAAGTGAYSATTDPARKFLYVGNDGAGTVSAYTIDATTGALTPVAGSPFATGALPDFIVVL